MQIVKAALEGYAHQYSRLGIRLNHAEAFALVVSVVEIENAEPKPSREEMQALADDFISLVDEMAATGLAP